ncbi:hypothetical protein [Comamonas granuli]|uniref:hypothetical protein n=1 Tax=Comamonas granuli TaxID=290309 RepID=UPI0012EC10AA|nr:hypothetical protein [Comamonas granuli]
MPTGRVACLARLVLLQALARRLLLFRLAAPVLLCLLAQLLLALRLLGRALRPVRFGGPPGLLFAGGGLRVRRRRRTAGALLFALVDGLLALAGALLALCLVELLLLPAQRVELAMRLTAHAAQAVLDGKALLALRLVLCLLLHDGRTLAADARPLGGALRRRVRPLLGGGLQGGPEQQQAQPDERAARRGHVSPVSTVRRSSCRYSLDCISFRRETVRGNSCASGPSV